jgi:predicted transcriptional regulator YheO
MTRVQRHEAVKVLVDKGMLNLKNALSEVAQILSIAHSTVYT